jgi:carbonic anhydrase
MKGVLFPDLLEAMPNVRSWLRHADAVRQILRENYAHLQGQALLRAAIEENVIVQINNLQTHPSVAARVRKGELKLHGWVYEIETGHVSAYDEEQQRFIAVRDVFIPAVPQVR